MKYDKLVEACRNDTSVLTSFIGWMDESLRTVEERSVQLNTTHEDWLVLKGKAQAYRTLRDELPKLVRLKEQDGAAEQQGIRRVR